MNYIEKNDTDNIEIKNIADYLKNVDDKIKELKRTTNSTFFCYRGEDRTKNDNGDLYFHSMPNIFRPDKFDKFDKYRWLEKNILDEIKSNNLSNSNEYLEVAMDAQHGGFPSRLLDVTFNSLIALFFAITPHFSTNVNKHDKDDGRVIVYAIDKMTTSSTHSIVNIYNELVNKKYNNRLDSYFHILIDFVDLNTRIKAQQGGFIMFGGNHFIPFPDRRVREIVIPSSSKSLLRKQLDLYFGINIGMIYPESDNKVNTIITRSMLVDNDVDYYSIIMNEIEFNLNNKIEHIMYLKKMCKEQSNSSYEEQFNNSIKELINYIYDICLSIESYRNSEKLRNLNNNDSKYIDEIIDKLILSINKNILYLNKRLNNKFNGKLFNPNILRRNND
ncbi:FRG domain-containing protein [Parvimonas micra]|uniref:FRG domain-containing protein n=1 Tax=Parvimonas micra TaxID=33033 RepID=UPI0022B61A49|nr:FRG domain-containing protein [Parvimonas micra]WBB30083.1 FRG domain-containing protein [Parvimonas micra]